MQLIQSRDNAMFKQTAKWVRQPRLLKKEGLAAAEGLHLLQELMAWKGLAITQVWVAESLLKHPEWLTLEAELNQRENVQLFSLPDHFYWQLSELQTGFGPLVLFRTPNHSTLPQKAADVVLIDGVQDPGNLGTLVRTAAAAGITEIWTTEGTVWEWSAKVLRAGMGGHRLVKFRRVSSDTLPEWVWTCQIIATDLNATEPIYTADLKNTNVWLVGNEGAGISAEWRALANKLVVIPHAGDVESLNVAVATGVCLFEQLRQRRFSLSQR